MAKRKKPAEGEGLTVDPSWVGPLTVDPACTGALHVPQPKSKPPEKRPKTRRVQIVYRNPDGSLSEKLPEPVPVPMVSAIVAAAARELRSVRERYKTVRTPELAAVWAAIDSLPQ